MARTKIPVTKLSENGSVADPAATTLSAENDHYVTGAPLEELVLEVAVTSEAGGTVTIVAGDNPPASSAGQGALKVELAKDKVAMVGPFTSARFIQAGAEAGQLFVDVAEGTTGTVRAYHVPREA